MAYIPQDTLTARQHVAAAVAHLRLALDRVPMVNYQAGAEPAIPVGLVSQAYESLLTYSVAPEVL